MHIRPRELLDTVSRSSEQGEPSALYFIIAMMLLAMIGYFFVQHVIPVISKGVCDFMNYCIDAAGGLSP